MSRSIKIPEYKNPFIVVINNHVYRYKGGETIEVPDEVAEAIEDALELVPKPKRYLSKIAQRVEGSITELALKDLDGIEGIIPYAFNYCDKLANIAIPNSVRNIGDGAFFGCSGLEIVRFEDNSKMESIGTGAFGRCTGLVSVFLPEIPPTLADVDAFANIKSSCVFYCKTQASLDAYKKAENWSTLTGTYSFVVEP
jgi:hypothetical protein